MKLLRMFLVMAIGVAANGAHAACTSATQVKGVERLRAVLQGKTVCVARGDERWQEYHQPGGALIDYKKGPDDKKDPSKQVGSWSVSGSGTSTQLIHQYGSGASFIYTVHTITAGSSYGFCGGGGELIVTLRSGLGPC